jgi:hypothetical protein
MDLAFVQKLFRRFRLDAIPSQPDLLLCRDVDFRRACSIHAGQQSNGTEFSAGAIVRSAGDRREHFLGDRLFLVF